MQNKIKWITFLKSRVATNKNMEKKYEEIKYLASFFSINDLIIHFQKIEEKKKRLYNTKPTITTIVFWLKSSVFLLLSFCFFFSPIFCLDIDSHFVNNLLGFFLRSNLQFQVWISVEIWSIPFPTGWYLSLIVFFFSFFFLITFPQFF